MRERIMMALRGWILRRQTQKLMELRPQGWFRMGHRYFKWEPEKRRWRVTTPEGFALILNPPKPKGKEADSK